eukprot:7192228-Prymnesium_polylepis.1
MRPEDSRRCTSSSAARGALGCGLWGDVHMDPREVHEGHGEGRLVETRGEQHGRRPYIELQAKLRLRLVPGRQRWSRCLNGCCDLRGETLRLVCKRRGSCRRQSRSKQRELPQHRPIHAARQRHRRAECRAHTHGHIFAAGVDAGGQLPLWHSVRLVQRQSVARPGAGLEKQPHRRGVGLWRTVAVTDQSRADTEAAIYLQLRRPASNCGDIASDVGRHRPHLQDDLVPGRCVEGDLSAGERQFQGQREFEGARL